MSKNNQCFVVGNLGAAPIEKGKNEKTGSIVSFSIAETVQSFDPSSQTYRPVHTNWFPVVTFGKVADKVKASLQKGDRVAVQGKMKLSKYTSKSGEDKLYFEIVADEVALWKTLSTANSVIAEEPTEEDIPF